MLTQTNPGESEEFARLERAILGLLVTPYNQRPWSEDEIARAITLPGDVHEAVERLHKVGLVHRSNRLVSATVAAVRREEITQETDDNPVVAADRRMEGEILHVLFQTRNVLPMSEKDIRRALCIRKKNKLDVIDALNRLDGAALVDRHGGLSVASGAAVRFDYIENV
jgi:hypothetical protein